MKIDNTPSTYDRAVAKIDIITAANDSNATYAAEILEREKQAERELDAMIASMAAGRPLPSEVLEPVIVKSEVQKALIPNSMTAVQELVTVPLRTRMDYLELNELPKTTDNP